MHPNSGGDRTGIDCRRLHGVWLSECEGSFLEARVRSILTAWSAIAALGVCPFFCMAAAHGDSTSTDQTAARSCCERCCGSPTPAGDKDGDHDPCCQVDCLCKGALPVEPPVSPPPHLAAEMLPMESPAVALHLAADGGWNSLQTPPDPDAGGRGLRIALCSFLC